MARRIMAAFLAGVIICGSSPIVADVGSPQAPLRSPSPSTDEQSLLDRASAAAPVQRVKLLEELVAIRQRASGLQSEPAADALTRLGQAQLEVGALESAERSFKSAIEIRERLFGPNSNRLASPLVGLMLVARRFANDRVALALARRTHALEGFSAISTDLKLSAAVVIGTLATKEGEFDESVSALREAKAIAAESRREDWQGLVLATLAKRLADAPVVSVEDATGHALWTERQREAVELGRQAISLLERSEAATRRRVETLEVVGRASRILQDYAGAKQAYDTAISLLQIKPSATDQEVWEFARLQGISAQLALRIGDPKVALDRAWISLETSAPILIRERALFNFQSDMESGVTLGAAQTALASAAILSGNHPQRKRELVEKALYASQRIQGIWTGAAFALGDVLGAADQAGARESFTGWRDAIQSRRIAERLLSKNETPANVVVLGRDYERKKEAERAAEASFLTRFPSVYAKISPDPVGLSELQGLRGTSLLREDEALVVLAAVRDANTFTVRGVIVVVTLEDVAIAPLSRNISRIFIRDVAERDRPFNLRRAHTQYRDLFGDPDVARILATKSRWLIAASEEYASIPFGALIVEPPRPLPEKTSSDAETSLDAAILRQADWLALKKELVILPSVVSLRVRTEAGKSKRWRPNSFFGVGDPAFTGAADTGVRAGEVLPASRYIKNGVADLDVLATLPRLHGTQGEILALASLLTPEAVLMQLDATEAEVRLRASELEMAEVVAFATHGLLPTSWDGEPALALTAPIRTHRRLPAPNNDGLLTMSEIQGLRLNARLVILSACNTAGGDRIMGMSFTGLAAAFLSAGARGLLVTYFEVRDDAAPRLTVPTVRDSREGRVSTAAAMQKAIRAVMSDTEFDGTDLTFAHPSAWAAFAVVDAN